jgi:DNA invertase Pin-like site-specific DNA recombinase
MALIGYARVSTEEQATDAQVDLLTAAGCAVIFTEHMSGAKASRPQLAKALARIKRGDVLVVARLDRLARSLAHLLSVIADLDARGAHFKSLADPIDTTTPQGRFALQVLGAVAELERALIQERTKDGLRAARKRGRIGGNPRLRAKDPQAIAQIAEARRQSYFERVNQNAQEWLPTVRQMRPEHRWEDVVRVLNGRAGGGARWTAERLKRAVKRFVAEGLAEPILIAPARRRPSSERLVTLVAGIARANPQMTLAEIGSQLEAMFERTPRGGTRWAASSVKSLLDRAEKLGILARR